MRILFILCVCWGIARANANDVGWGIDACVTTHVTAPARKEYLSQLKSSGVEWLRERQPVAAMNELHADGRRVVSFLKLEGLATPRAGNQLSEDLLAVFAAAQAMQQKHHAYVDAWEMVGEPDLGYCTDLPDRLAAFQKAVYLGIKRGALDSGSRRLALGNRAADNTLLKKESDDVDASRVDGRSLNGFPPTGQRLPATDQQAPTVLMGALGNPPGPWLERAAQNGLFDYTDAYNFHFYGHAKDFTSEINAHAAFVSKWTESGRPWTTSDKLAAPVKAWFSRFWKPSPVHRSPSTGLPLWITECGIDAVDPDDFLNPARRQIQAEFTVSTAAQAWAHPRVAMFMPFILVHDKDPYAMTLSADRPLPAWNAYSTFTRENPWPNRPLTRPPVAPNPVVMQWLPDNRTTTPHKVSGTYRFKGNAAIVGEVRMYNFSEQAIRGRLVGGRLIHARVDFLSHNAQLPPSNFDLLLAPMSMISLPVTITATTPGYFSEFWSAEFVGEDGRKSPLYFGIERVPAAEDFVRQDLTLKAKTRKLKPDSSVVTPVSGFSPQVSIRHPIFDDYRVTSQSGAWVGINGLVLEDKKLEMGDGRWEMGDGKFKRGEGRSKIAGSLPAPGGSAFVPDSRDAKRGPTALTAWITAIENDPLAPPMAVARIKGLPPQGFIYLHTDRPMNATGRVRVDLLDKEGRRFSIWENLGMSYYGGNKSEAWLNLADFHNFSWGRTTTDPRLHPKRVEEIQLRFYFSKPGTPLTVSLEFRQASNGFHADKPKPAAKGWANLRN